MKQLSKIGSVFKIFSKKFPLLKNISPLYLILILSAALSVGFFFSLSFIEEDRDWKMYLQKADKFYQEAQFKKAKKIYLELKEKFPSNPRIDWINYQLGNIFEKEEFFNRAIFFYEKVKKRNVPYFFDARLKLAQCYRRTGDIENALNTVKKIIKEFSDVEKLAPVYLIFADSLLEKSEEKKAVSLYQKLIEDYPESFSAAKAYLRLGDIYFRKKRYSEAILFYSSLIREYPKSEVQEEALYRIIRCYLEKRKVNEALSMLYLLIKNYPQSKFFKEAYFYLGKVLLEEGEIKKAQETFGKVIKMCTEKSSFLMEVKKELAKAYLIEKKFEEAIKIYEQILKDYSPSKTEDVCFTLGTLYLRTSHYDKATEIFQKFIHYYPLSFKISFAYYKLGKAFYEQKLYLKAIDAFNKALFYSVSKEEKERIFSDIAEAYSKVGLWKKAVEYEEKRILLAGKEKVSVKLIKYSLQSGDLSSAKKLLSLFLKNTSKQGILEVLNFVNSLYSMGEREFAFNVYQKIKEHVTPQDNKEWIFALYKMADFQRKRKNIESAIDKYQKILKLTSEGYEDTSIREKVLLNLADLYYQTQKYQKASSIYLQLIKEYPKSDYLSWCLYQIANSLRHSHLLPEAQKFYTTLEEKFPQSFWTKLSKALL